MREDAAWQTHFEGTRKSFVDDLTMERGRVSTRVVLHYDLLSVSLRSSDFPRTSRFVVVPYLFLFFFLKKKKECVYNFFFFLTSILCLNSVIPNKGGGLVAWPFRRE